MFNKLWYVLTFDLDQRKTPRILLGIFLVLLSICTYFIYRNPDQFINYPLTENILNLENVSVDVLAAIDPNITPEQKQAATVSRQKTLAAANGNSSQPSSATSALDGSSTGGEATAAEPASAYVAFYADNQSDSDDDDARHLNVVNRILASGANPVVNAGDIMEDGTEASWNRFLNIAGTLLGTKTFYATLGNNDRVVGDSSTPSPYFLNYFNFPNNERWYSVNSGNLHIVVLDSAFASSSATQLSWLSSDLQSEASQTRITVVVFHHPTFASTISSYIQNYGVDFVVCGHVHTYVKSTVGGATIFTLPGGTSIGHATALVYNDYATFKAYDINGSLIETTQINER